MTQASRANRLCCDSLGGAANRRRSFFGARLSNDPTSPISAPCLRQLQSRYL